MKSNDEIIMESMRREAESMFKEHKHIQLDGFEKKLLIAFMGCAAIIASVLLLGVG